jgi:Ran GTPase-activating protein (RanGAP) involved in mRNA processing and transport
VSSLSVAGGRQMECTVAELTPVRVLFHAAPYRGSSSITSLAQCTRLIADPETRPWAAGVTPLATAIMSEPQPILESVALRNVPLDAHSLRLFAASFGKCINRRRKHLRLRRLELENNGLQAQDVPALISLLDALPSLHALCIRSNLLGPSGIGELRAYMRGRQTLRSLELADTGAGAGAVRALLHMIATRRAGTASSSPCFNLTIFSPATAGGLPRHESSLSRALRVPLDHGGASPPRRVALRRVPWMPATVRTRRKGFAPRPHALALGFADNSLGDHGARRLSEFLVRAFFGRNGLALPALVALDVRDNGIGDDGARVLSSALSQLPMLSHLDLRGNPIDADGFLALLSLCSHPPLSRLYLPAPPLATPIQDAGNSSSSWPASHTKRADSIISCLSTSGLRELRVPHWDWISTAGLISLFDALGSGSVLTRLDMQGAHIHPPAVHALTRALASDSCRLVTLNLASTGLSMVAVIRIARALHNNTRLRLLGLSHNNVGASGARALIEAATVNTNLVHVSVLGSGVGLKWQGTLARALKQNIAHLPTGRVSHAGSPGGEVRHSCPPRTPVLSSS